MAEQDIQKINQSIKETIQLLRQLTESLHSAQGGFKEQDRATASLVQNQIKLNQLLAERSRLLKSANVRPNVAGGNPQQAPLGQPALDPAPRAFNPIKLLTPNEILKAKKANDAYVQALQKEVDAVNKASKAAQHLAQARERVANSPEYRQALEQAQARGFGVQNLQSIEDRGGGIQKLRFAQQSGGVNQQFNPYVNTRTGTSTPGLSSQFRSFGSDILRDIGQFTKWSIAVAAVYTPLQKLGELITIMIDNESKLADAAIAANLPFEKQGEIFDNVATAANAAGESINTTIDAYAQAVRAAGRYETQEEKTQKAGKLLSDSLILSKLSALDQATAIDTLSAALLQSDRELDQGQELLNKWVRVSQVANVGMDALATGVAVLGDAAETSGLDIDHLNALIAVLSEQSISGSKEAANTAKALIGSYQSDKSEQVLNRYGIALRKANGEVRSFLSVYQDLARLRKEGVLSDAAVSEVALALGGGGVRRAKDASALINSQDRLNKLAAESAAVTGDSTLAQDSLAKKLETVQTATTRLSNAWQELAQTLGDDGGLLDLFKGLIDGLTGITKAADDLFTLLGRSGPILATFSTGLLALRAIKPGTRETLLAGLGAGQGGFAGFMGGQAQYGARGQPGGIGGLAANLLQMNYKGAGAIGGAGVALSGLSNLSQGKNEQALANVIGGVMGGAIGAALGGPPGLAAGALIGSSAAEAMTNSIVNYKPEWSEFFGETFKPPTKPEEVGGVTDKQALVDEAAKASGISDLAARYVAGFLNAVPDKLVKRFLESSGGKATGLIPEELRGKDFEYTGEKFTALQYQLANAPKEYQSRIKKLQERDIVQEGGLLPQEEVKFTKERLELEKQATAEKEKQLKLLAEGKITPAQFGRVSQQLTGFPATAIQSVEAYGDKFIEIGKDIDNTKEAYDAFLYIAANGTEEQIAQLSQYSTDIRTLQHTIENFEPGDIGQKLTLTFGDVTIESRKQLESVLSGLQVAGAQTAVRTGLDIRLQKLKLPGIVGSATEATSETDVAQIKQQAEKLQEQFYTDMNLTNDEIVHLTSNLEDFSLLVERAGEDHFETITGIDQKFWDAAQKLLVEQGKLKEEKGIGFQKFDLPMSELSQLAAQSLSIGQSWQDKFNYDFKPEDQIAIDNQGIVQPLHADFKILALLLEKLNEKAQKQLDGQYNIPEGATFWVPLTAAYYRNKGGEEGGALDTSMLDTSANNLDGAANSLQIASQALIQSAYWQSEKRGYVPIQEGSEVKKREEYQYTNPPLQYGGDLKMREEGSYLTPSTTAPTTEDQSILGGKYGRDYLTPLNSLIDAIRNLFNGGGTASFRDSNREVGQLGSLTDKTATTTAPVSSTTKLDLSVSSNINLLVDGRVLASTLQNYLASELLKTEQSQGTISKRYVI